MTRMQRPSNHLTALAFPVCTLSVAAYVWLSTKAMPEVIASHFDAAGRPNGFMPRQVYGLFMSGLILVLPLLVVYLPNAMLRRAPKLINLPHRQYWLAPERLDETIARLSRGSVGLGYLLVAFLGYVHHLVVIANKTKPPTLPSALFVAGLGAFVVASLIWGWLYIRPFLRVPASQRGASLTGMKASVGAAKMPSLLRTFVQGLLVGAVVSLGVFVGFQWIALHMYEFVVLSPGLVAVFAGSEMVKPPPNHETWLLLGAVNAVWYGLLSCVLVLARRWLKWFLG